MAKIGLGCTIQKVCVLVDVKTKYLDMKIGLLSGHKKNTHNNILKSIGI